MYQTQYHLVWGTKYRRKILKNYVKTELIKSFYATQRQHPDWYFHTLNTGIDHVHLHMEIPPKYAVAAVVQRLKANSSSHLKRQFPFVRRIYHKRGGLWSVGYFVSTVGLNEDMIRRYIEHQDAYDRGTDVSAEFS